MKRKPEKTELKRRSQAVGCFLWFLLLGLDGMRCPAATVLKVASVLSSDMVLQQQMPVRIWGWTLPGDAVAVEFAGQRKSAKADAHGAWQVLLDPMPASAEPRTLSVTSTNAVASPLVLTNVVVGARLALAARALAYGEKIVYTGPLVKSAEAVDGAVRVRFDHVGGGHVARAGDGSFSAKAPLTGIALAGADGKYAWADAAIEADTVVVRCAAVPQPVSVRYAWANHPVCTLFNREGLPASPFQSGCAP
jgi:hypothetical protein